ncbi:DUF3443 family protein [Trinickia terrae]|uniref:DUF3443 family protein n=1 Tax=Trinickia terrae TaxID=2571161 RepID=A0A4U1I5N9_9BURK|nr:DUF3443 family protein [Trinickia terrae]TKC88669.1 DUF3443 family protein [Trinickia terrae]
MKPTRLLWSLAALVTALALTACGGGGGGSSGTSSNSSTSSSSSSSTSTTTTVANVQTFTIGSNPFSVPNAPMTSVTICVPGTTTCQTIDNILVDTGSSGLRIQSSVLSIGLTAATATGGGTLAECMEFGSGFTWGSVRNADVKIGGETASNIPIQVAGDSVGPIPTSNCTGATEMDTPANMNANGILGIGNLAQDCPSCTATANNTTYYSCASSSTACTLTATPLTAQVINPVAAFSTDNNGVVVQLPAVTQTAASVTGTMTFGIGTASNNTLGSATIFTTQSDTSFFNSTLGSTTTPFTIIDSGSNGYFLPNTGITQCSGSTGWFCPSSTQSLTATLQGVSGNTKTVSFSIASEATLIGTGNWALNGLGANVSTTLTTTFGSGKLVDLGLPFFYGRTVYTAIQGKSTPGGTGPYVAF